MRGNKIRRTSIYIMIVCAFLLIVNATLGIVLTIQSSESLKTQMRERMLDIANTAAAMIDGDALGAIQADDAGSDEYEAVLKTLTYYQDNINLDYIYCIRDLGNKQFVFTIDPTVNDPGEFGEPIAYTDALYEASLGTSSVDLVPYEDRWGRFYSAYAPVFDSKGKVSGIVAVDFSADWYDGVMKSHFKSIALISIISLLGGVLVVLTIAYRARKRYTFVYDELNSLTDGIETLANELTTESVFEGGTELLKEFTGETRLTHGDIYEMGDKIRALEKYMSRQITFVRAKAYRDGLTGLENRTAYLEHIHMLDEEIGNGTADFCVAMFDINGLKDINDELGHEIGDRAIKKAAQLLSDAFEGERVFRIGGDEFVVDLKCDQTKIERLMNKFDGMLLVQDRSDGLPEVTISKGFAIYTPGRDKSHQDVFSRADNEMYSDKKRFYLTHSDRRRAR
ncbi:MAG: diguanylate cyclase [Lachnospiraceae bacterium]|nr:diguanylate cyclase [Lachnospiraceae bacterium]